MFGLVDCVVVIALLVSGSFLYFKSGVLEDPEDVCHRSERHRGLNQQQNYLLVVLLASFVAVVVVVSRDGSG
jgi:hypothetical protein